MTGKVGMGTGKMGMGIGEWEKMGNENVVLSISKNCGEWGLGNGFQNGECIRGF